MLAPDGEVLGPDGEVLAPNGEVLAPGWGITAFLMGKFWSRNAVKIVGNFFEEKIKETKTMNVCISSKLCLDVQILVLK